MKTEPEMSDNTGQCCSFLLVTFVLLNKLHGAGQRDAPEIFEKLLLGSYGMPLSDTVSVLAEASSRTSMR